MRTLGRYASVCAIALLAATGTAHAASRPVVLELFTSEGCSSCPPAEALLATLAERRDLLPLAFHVTYWNSLGWHDPFSFEAATSRQLLYAARLGGGSYTPEMVVDGRYGMVGSDEGEVGAAIAQSRADAQAALPLAIRRTGNSVSISVGAGDGRGRILLVGFDPRRESTIGRGENSGLTLTEANVVRSMATVGTYDGAAVTLTAPRGAGADAAVIIQAPDGRFLAAARL
jgi:hypothetical protein